MSGFIGKILGGGGVAKTVEGIAKEWIETAGEKAGASALMLKTLDPNGMMRRDIAHAVTRLYSVFLLVSMVLVVLQSLGWSPTVMVDGEPARSVDLALESVKALFQPLTILFGTIVAASFGVNGINAARGQ